MWWVVIILVAYCFGVSFRPGLGLGAISVLLVAVTIFYIHSFVNSK